MRIDPMILWLALWETIPALAQVGIAFVVAWAMLTVLDWILDELALKGGDGIEDRHK